MGGVVANTPHPREALAAQTRFLPRAAAAAVRRLDIDADLARLRAWLDGLMSSEPPSRDVLAFYFGIVEVETSSGTESTCDLYLSGSDWFDADDDECEWAVGPVYFPAGRYAKSSAMARLGEIGRTTESVPPWMLTAVYAIAAVRTVCVEVGPERLLIAGKTGRVPARAVAAGHDEGRAWVLGAIATGGWVGIDEVIEPE